MPTESAARLPAHLRSLADLGRSGDVSMRPILFRVICDLFVLKRRHSADELRQFEEMALKMMAEVGSGLIALVAQRLASHPETPTAVLRHMLGCDPAVAAIVIQHASDLDLGIQADIAASGSPELARALAARADLASDLTDILARRPEDAVVSSLLDNSAAVLTAASQTSLIQRGQATPEIGGRLAHRSDVSGDMAPLFLSASPERRAEIILAARRSELGGSIGRRRDAATLARIERLAIQRDWPACAVALANAMFCGVAQSRRLIEDPSGEAFALALCGLGMSAEAGARIFMSMDPAIAHSADKVRALTELLERMPQPAAERLVASMLGLPAARPAGAEPKPFASRPAAPDMGATSPMRTPGEYVPERRLPGRAG